VSLPDELAATLLVCAALDELGVEHVIGGSVASSLHGRPRSTQDVDLVADLRLEHAPRLAAALSEQFYVDEQMILDATRRRASFNVVHLASMTKIDIFVPRDEAVVRQQLVRRVQVSIGDAPAERLWLVSPEDIILQKLIWHDAGGRTSQRQLRDVAGVIEVQGERLDREYLEHWSEVAGVDDLLAGLLDRRDSGDGA